MTLELYYFDSCPYCRKVLSVIEKQQNKIILKDIHSNHKFYDELVNKTGDYQVPCLSINGAPMLESDDIIDYLESHISEWTTSK